MIPKFSKSHFMHKGKTSFCILKSRCAIIPTKKKSHLQWFGQEMIEQLLTYMLILFHPLTIFCWQNGWAFPSLIKERSCKNKDKEVGQFMLLLVDIKRAPLVQAFLWVLVMAWHLIKHLRRFNTCLTDNKLSKLSCRKPGIQ